MCTRAIYQAHTMNRVMNKCFRCSRSELQSCAVVCCAVDTTEQAAKHEFRIKLRISETSTSVGSTCDLSLVKKTLSFPHRGSAQTKLPEPLRRATTPRLEKQQMSAKVETGPQSESQSLLLLPASFACKLGSSHAKFASADRALP